MKDIVDSIQGKGLAGAKDRVKLAPSADEADLVVEVVARRSEKTLPTQIKADRCFVLFNIGAGSRLGAERFAKVPADYRFRKFGWSAWKIQSPRPDRPVFTFECFNDTTEFGCFGHAGNAASVVIEKFIEDNYGILTAN